MIIEPPRVRAYCASPLCRVMFVPVNDDTVYCSPQCRRKAARLRRKGAEGYRHKKGR